MKTSMFLSFLLLVAVGTARATSKNPVLAGIWLYDPLQHSHLIVRGTVQEVRVERATHADWFTVREGDRGADWPLDIVKIRFMVAEVLKGEWNEWKIVFVAYSGQQSLFRPGHEHVICGVWKVRNNEGAFRTGSSTGVYSRKDGRWERVVDPMTGGGETLTHERLLSRIRRASLTSVTDSSDVVARGTITSIRDSQYETGDGRVGALRHYRVQLHELLRGYLARDSLEFVVPTYPVVDRERYMPPWYRRVPDGIDEGQEWCVFLRHGDRGLYPFAGVNSLLKVEGPNLIYDMAVRYPLDLEQATQIVRSAVRDAKP